MLIVVMLNVVAHLMTVVEGYLHRQMIEAKTQVRASVALLALAPLGNTTSIEKKPVWTTSSEEAKGTFVSALRQDGPQSNNLIK